MADSAEKTSILSIAGASGVAAALINCVLWISFLLANPYRGGAGGQSFPLADRRQILLAGVMVALWLAGAWAAATKRFRLMFAIGVLAFLPVGLYVLMTPGIFSAAGSLNILFLILALVSLRTQRGSISRR